MEKVMKLLGIEARIQHRLAIDESSDRDKDQETLKMIETRLVQIENKMIKDLNEFGYLT